MAVHALPGKRLHREGPLYRTVLRARQCIRSGRGSRRRLSRLRAPNGNRHRRKLLLQTFRVPAKAPRFLCGQSRFHPAGEPPERGSELREWRAEKSIDNADNNPVGNSSSRRSAARLLCVVRCADRVSERRRRAEFRRAGPLACGIAYRRQGNYSIPRGLLARVSDGGGFAAARKNLGAWLAVV